MLTLCQPTSVASTPGIRIACWLLVTVQAEWGNCDSGCLTQRRLQDMHSRAGHCTILALLFRMGLIALQLQVSPELGLFLQQSDVQVMQAAAADKEWL